VEGNARLTGYVAVLLLVLFAVETATVMNLRQLLVIHALVGVFAVPLIMLKLASVGYMFTRYYTRESRYRAAGPPSLPMRVLGPILVVLTLVVFGSGLELWLFGYRFGFVWVPVHHASAYLWFLAIGIHVAVYLRRAPALAAAVWHDHLKDAMARRSLVVAGLVLGLALVIAMLSIASPFAWLSGV
jgi:hypothetical protein